MRPAYKQHVREFVKDGRATLVNHSLDEGLRLKDARNRPSGNPNCGLFPQGPIIPVPPSSSPYRPVGICGNNWAVSPDRHAKESLRTRGFGGSYSRYFAGGFALWRRRNSTRRYSAHQNASSEASFRYSHSFTLVCRGAIPIGSSLVVGFVHLAAESLRMSSRKRLGQALGQIRKLFRNHEPAVSFLSREQKRVGFEALKRPI